MEKIYFSRTEISQEAQMLLAKVSMLTKQLNSLTLAELSQKEDIVRQLFGTVGSNPFIGDNFHCDFGLNIHVGDKNMISTVIPDEEARLINHNIDCLRSQ